MRGKSRRLGRGGCQAVVTVDKNIEFQQNLNRLPLTVVVLDAGASDLHTLQPLVPKAVSMLDSSVGKTLIKVRVDRPDETDEDEQTPKTF